MREKYTSAVYYNNLPVLLPITNSTTHRCDAIMPNISGSDRGTPIIANDITIEFTIDGVTHHLKNQKSGLPISLNYDTLEDVSSPTVSGLGATETLITLRKK